MEILIYILAIFGLQFTATQLDGPFGIFAWIRNKILLNKYLGVQFDKLISCPVCSGTWAGWTIYFITQENYKLGLFAVWGLTGGATCLILNAVVARLHRE